MSFYFLVFIDIITLKMIEIANTSIIGLENKSQISIVFEDLIQDFSQDDNYSFLKPAFKTDDVALYVGDCLNIMSRFPANCIDMIFADPPYTIK